MEHTLLTETEFFKCIGSGENVSHADMQVYYNQFAEAAIALSLAPKHPCEIFAALTFTEVELEHYVNIGTNITKFFVKKALSFIRKLARHRLSSSLHYESKVKRISSENAPPRLKWTGNVVELIEMIYGLDELKCINDGELGIKGLLAHFGKIFGLDIKDNQGYNAYVDMKRRKSRSRTYFLDNMSIGLNRRMDEDDEKEKNRR